MVTMYGGAEKDQNVEDELEDHSNLWDFKSFADNEFWFLKTDTAQDALQVASLTTMESHHAAIRKKELCFLTIPNLIFTVEAGVGNKTLPMLLLESSFRGKVNDWSSKVNIKITMQIFCNYIMLF